MQQTYEYMRVISSLDTIEVPDIGNCILQECNDLGLIWYLYIKTSLGRSTIIEIGPFNDKDIYEGRFIIKKKTIEFKERIIDSTLRKFIEDPKRDITQIQLIAIDEFEKIKQDALNQL